MIGYDDCSVDYIVFDADGRPFQIGIGENTVYCTWCKCVDRLVFELIEHAEPIPSDMRVLAHRRELLTQAIGHSSNAGLQGSLEMAANSASRKADVVCASVATLMATSTCKPCYGTGKNNGVTECSYCSGRGKVPRMERFNPHEFSLIVTDEAHHGTAKSYRTIYLLSLGGAS